MKETLSVVIPTEWKDITLKKWLGLQKDLEDYKDDEEAQNQLYLWHLCGLDIDVVKRLPQEKYEVLVNKLQGLGNAEDLPLQRIVNINGIEYGFEPNLSQMSYAAYADITQWESVGIDKNWGKVMSILYRPIINKKGDKYSIQPYDGSVDDSIWIDTTMDIHFGAMFFFLHTSMDLQNAILKSLTETELHPSIKQTLVRSGKLMQQYMNLPKVISKGLIQ